MNFVAHPLSGLVFLPPMLCASALLFTGCAGQSSTDAKDDTTVDTGTPSGLPTVYVNEVMSSNATVLADELGAYPDWVELYNPGDADVDLSGWWLTDDVADVFKWLVPDAVTIPAGGYLVVFCDNDTEEGDLHASFNLAAIGGEDVALFGPNVLDNPRVDALEDMQALPVDVALARNPDGGPTWEIDGGPTPGASNN